MISILLLPLLISAFPTPQAGPVGQGSSDGAVLASDSGAPNTDEKLLGHGGNRGFGCGGVINGGLGAGVIGGGLIGGGIGGGTIINGGAGFGGGFGGSIGGSIAGGVGGGLGVVLPKKQEDNNKKLGGSFGTSGVVAGEFGVGAGASLIAGGSAGLIGGVNGGIAAGLTSNLAATLGNTIEGGLDLGGQIVAGVGAGIGGQVDGALIGAGQVAGGISVGGGVTSGVVSSNQVVQSSTSGINSIIIATSTAAEIAYTADTAQQVCTEQNAGQPGARAINIDLASGIGGAVFNCVLPIRNGEKTGVMTLACAPDRLLHTYQDATCDPVGTVRSQIVPAGERRCVPGAAMIIPDQYYYAEGWITTPYSGQRDIVQYIEISDNRSRYPPTLSYAYNDYHVVLRDVGGRWGHFLQACASAPADRDILLHMSWWYDVSDVYEE